MLAYLFGKPQQQIDITAEVTEIKQIFKIGDQIIEF
jgi:hypothetical protein